jgi:hypothetical protein
LGPALLLAEPATVVMEVLHPGPEAASADTRAIRTPRRFPHTAGVALTRAADCVFLRVTRDLEWIDAEQTVEFGLVYGNLLDGLEPETLLEGEALPSPLKHFPSGADAFLTPGWSDDRSFLQYVANAYPTLLLGLPSALYELGAELLVGATPPPVDGPTPPSSSVRHINNYCGISAFIHSMANTFPGALDPALGKDEQWDDVGDKLDHSNTFGVRVSKMVDQINENYRDKPAANGKRYCAKSFTFGKGFSGDISTKQLAEYKKHCDVKMCIEDTFPSDAKAWLPGQHSRSVWHWVDITAVTETATGADLQVQDYGRSYTVPANQDAQTLDFTHAAGSTMGDRGKNFGGWNPTERIYFCIVCECGDQGGQPVFPDPA